MSLSSLIVQREVATMRQVEEALSRQVLYGGDLVTNLLEVAQLPENVLVPLLAESLGMPHAPPGELAAPDQRSRMLVPEELATRRALMPLRVETSAGLGDRLLLAVAEPLPDDVVDELAFALGMPIEQRIAPMVRIRQAISVWYGVPLERRMRRLVGRLGGEATEPGSLPPLLRDAPPVPEAPRPISVPPAARVPDPTPPPVEPTPGPSGDKPPGPTPTPTEEVPPVESTISSSHPPKPAVTVEAEPDERGFGDPGLRERAAGWSPRPPVSEPMYRVPDSIRTRPTPILGSPQAKARITNVGFPAAGQAPRSERPPSLVQRGRGGFVARPGRRRRGPLALEQAKQELDAAEDRDTLLDLVFDFACQYFDYTALFLVHGDIAEGRDAFGSGASRETVAAMGVPLDLPGMLATAREKCAPIVARPAPTGMDSVLMSDLERRTRTPILVVPVVVRQRAVAIVVGDGGDAGVDGTTQGEVAAFAILVGQAFERIIVRRKLGGFTGAAGQPGAAKIDPARVGSKPPRRSNPPLDRAAAATVLERVLVGDRPGAVRRSSAPPARPGDTPPPSRSTRTPVPAADAEPNDEPATTFRPVLRAPLIPRDSELFAAVSSLPPPPQVLAVRRPSKPPIPREEPEPVREKPEPDGDEEPFALGRSEAESPDESIPISLDATTSTMEELDDGLLDSLIEEPPTSGPGSSVPVQIVVPPHLPPVSVRASPEPLASVIVDVEREFSAMVDRLIRDPSDEHAEGELLRQGQYAMPAIMAHFPGPLRIKRDTMDDLSPPRVTECGPILRLIAGQRRVALPFVLAQVDSRDADRRFWATFLLSELAYPEAVPAVVSRLFDEDEGTRRVARLAARAVAEVAPEPLVERLDRIVGDPQASPERRVATLDTLGDMRDAIVVPALIGALGDESEEVGQAARRALMTVTRQDFGGESRKWLTWWGTNSARHRIEWLIDALTHDLPAIRRVAGQELKAITKEYFGYYDDLPKKERERAQQRYREWWKSEGRARFRRGRDR